MPMTGEYAPLPPVDWIRDQVETWERTGGREGTRQGELGVVIVVNRGAKSGLLHRTPVMRVEHEGRFLAVGSKGGAPQNPGWVSNLRANPQVELWDGTERADYVAREIDGEERAEWWERAVDVFPPYADYQANTDRLIPLFLLEPAAG